MNSTHPTELLTTLEASEQSGLSMNYIALLARKGKILGIRPARDWMIDSKSLANFTAKPRKPGPKGPRQNKG